MERRCIDASAAGDRWPLHKKNYRPNMGIDWKHRSSDSDCITFPQKLSQQSACCRLRFYKDWTAYILRRRPDALPRRDSNPRREKLARGIRRRKGDEEQDVWFGQSRRHHQNALGRLMNRLFSGATSSSCLTILNNVTVYWSRTGGGGRTPNNQLAGQSVRVHANNVHRGERI